MKQLTKEELTDVVYNNWEKVYESNINGKKERLMDSIKGSGDNCAELMVKLIISYGNEIMNECSQVITETLYNVLYTE
ncbi:MAG: hypothetical protein K2I96_10165 [Lachnospiraceae bacterium]|nr:hypothetical protein [Lachnospiraceae bacterium]